METSLMLGLQPNLVDMAAARDFTSSAEDAAISPVGPVSYGWIATDLNPSGVVGNAAVATAEKGRATAAHQVARLIALIRAVRARQLDGLMPIAPG